MARSHPKIAKPNHTPEMIDELTAGQLAELSTAEIRSLQDHLDEQKATLDRRRLTLQMALLRKFGDRASFEMRAANKDAGIVHVIDGGIDVTCKVDKAVKWDQELLKAALDQLATINPDLPKHYADIKLSVSETNYKTAPPQIQNILQAARTVITRKMAFTLGDTKS